MATKMAPDLLNQIINEFQGDTLSRIAAVVGAEPGKTRTALTSLVPGFLGGLANRASTTGGANEVIDLIRKSNLTSISVDDLTRPENITSATNIGRSALDLGFGDKLGSVTDWIASYAGLNRATVGSLATVCGPLILGLIGRRLGSSPNASSLTSLLGSPSKYFQNASPGLVRALGLGSGVATARQFVDDTERRAAAAVPESSSPFKWLIPVLLGIGAIALIAYLISRRTEPTNIVTTQPTARTEAPAPAPVAQAPAVPTSANLGAFIDTKLPNGVNLNIPTNGIESKLLAFINDPARAVDNTTWFSFDRLEFETDSARLKPTSREQLLNVAAILKAYPNVAVKIGGYTDNTGDPAHNLKLSQDRANATLNELVALGIPNSQLAAEGYGEQFPVADNSTPEGRQRNRRIDIRVTKK
jgi:outer membrane protein OmpA-like peptidoglycan-associated protein